MTKIIITGASGMIGNLILKEACASDSVDQIISIGRKNLGLDHPKLREIVHQDFGNYQGLEKEFKDIQTAYFCIGVYTGAVDRETFRKITVDYTLGFAEFLKIHSPDCSFCLLSGAGADRSEKSRMMFAKDKGVVENALSAMDFKSFHTFRPGYIYPVEKRKEPNFSYSLMRTMYPLLKLFGKNASIKSTELSKAMFKVGLEGGEQEIYENKEILGLA